MRRLVVPERKRFDGRLKRRDPGASVVVDRPRHPQTLRGGYRFSPWTLKATLLALLREGNGRGLNAGDQERQQASLTATIVPQMLRHEQREGGPLQQQGHVSSAARHPAVGGWEGGKHGRCVKDVTGRGEQGSGYDLAASQAANWRGPRESALARLRQ